VMRCYDEAARAWVRPFDESFGVERWWSGRSLELGVR
jgi:hypothetical protein